MRLIVNGDPHEHQGDGSLGALLNELDVDPRRVAIMVNDEVVRRDAREKIVLAESDKVELLVFAGGG